MRPMDTSVEAHRLQLARYRAMTGEERVLAVAAFSEDLHAFAVASVRARHESYSGEDAEWAVRRMRLGDELFRRVWPGAPLLSP